MNITEGTMKEMKSSAISDRETGKIKELSNAPKDIDVKKHEANITKLEAADSIATERLNQQKEVVQKDTTKQPEASENLTFKHNLDPKLNKGNDISFGNGPCARACLKSGVRVGFHSGG